MVIVNRRRDVSRGVWKTLILHLIRLVGNALGKRFRSLPFVPSFPMRGRVPTLPMSDVPGFNGSVGYSGQDLHRAVHTSAATAP